MVYSIWYNIVDGIWDKVNGIWCISMVYMVYSTSYLGVSTNFRVL